MQEIRNSIANALELRLSCTNPSILKQGCEPWCPLAWPRTQRCQPSSAVKAPYSLHPFITTAIPWTKALSPSWHCPPKLDPASGVIIVRSWCCYDSGAPAWAAHQTAACLLYCLWRPCVCDVGPPCWLRRRYAENCTQNWFGRRKLDGLAGKE